MTKQRLTFDTAGEYVRTGEAAELVNCHINTIQNWIKAGRLPAERFGDSNRWRIKTSDLAAVVGLTLSNGTTTPMTDILTGYADRLEAALELPAGKMLESIQEIVEDMRREAK